MVFKLHTILRRATRGVAAQDDWITQDHRTSEQKAFDLLVSYLTPKECKQLHLTRSITIRGSNRRKYRLDWHREGNVKRLTFGRVLPWNKFCAYPGGSLPLADQILAQKLLLETDAKHFHKVALRFRI